MLCVYVSGCVCVSVYVLYVEVVLMLSWNIFPNETLFGINPPLPLKMRAEHVQ